MNYGCKIESLTLSIFLGILSRSGYEGKMLDSCSSGSLLITKEIQKCLTVLTLILDPEKRSPKVRLQVKYDEKESIYTYRYTYTHNYLLFVYVPLYI